ncbi:ergothioneine biosynthesis glutamate--cysteine ligase EgtA [Actinoplanes sp. NBRC 103695]|uniref:ergothioneine biosynthesis glutamate--cysteine ligase EgtA n=1 Tax=Actinoplanes sp. NBRC 103695 TaxID=3032202 RepID=UPI0024A3DA18|nr:ergothioneine biosynthesis glutamate--cysteine ligase EgtA [Actinoplanes sp. NBRC 103695]GLY99572.1 glutamate--cysteine ligase EgtA [Actinoplanes sp. NBRC 103695]
MATTGVPLVTTLDQGELARELRTEEEVAAHIRAICFKTGPPTLMGAELEWTVHPTAAPEAPLDPDHLRHVLGRYAPATFRPGHTPDPLPSGGTLTLEPGGQLEISSAPASATAALHAAVTADLAHLTALLDSGGLRLGEHGIDPYRPPRRLLDTPRYRAMERAFDAHGPHGRVMMGSTAGLQVCLDAGTPAELGVRWAAANALGPPLVALFANSTRHAGRDTGVASARMATWWDMDPRLTHPPLDPPDDPSGAWARYALAAPLVCVRRDDGRWDPPPGVTLADWVAGAVTQPLTTADVDYHLTTLFPPVRPHGYLEIRYLDAQPGDEWIAPVAMVTALFGDHRTTERALELAQPVAGRWLEAYRCGLADPALARTAAALTELAADRLDLPADLGTHVIDTIHRRLRRAGVTEEQ